LDSFFPSFSYLTFQEGYLTDAKDLGLPIVAGPSGTTFLLLMFANYLGFDVDALYGLRLAML
jgi:hypothetical protein